ncbi:hypothetical protein QG516_03285 [Pedobacter gandavensis]|uniref:hypothetical protein n=1 Tax=Pedobacter gandavensis TaxID=2679963 RepID=UPI00247921A6|nr:hypothetical protein [Pedobacter gandavensis]WGQ10677.1 hypothetical protein QG516_03285 [Pedobacter gandavensis]
MKTRQFFLLLALAAFTACASPEQRASKQSDSSSNKDSDSIITDTINNADGHSGDNGTGTDTTNTAEQKAIREAGR